MSISRIAVAAVAFAASLSVAGPAAAQMRGDKAVYFTFSQPVAIPQTTLPAGKYLFRLADSMVNRTIVQIYSADGSKLHAMLMTRPTQRPQIANDPEVRFLETAANQPPAIATYWYAGERSGWEFIYPRAEARRLAQSSKSNVLTTAQDATGDQIRSADLVRVSPTGEQVSADADPVPAEVVTPRTERGEVAATVPELAQTESAPAATTVRNATREARRALPATASTLPLVTMVGGLAAFVALVAARSRRARG